MAYFLLEQRRWRRYCLESNPDTGPKIVAGNTFSDGIGYKCTSCDDTCMRCTPQTGKARPSSKGRIWKNLSELFSRQLSWNLELTCSASVFEALRGKNKETCLPHSANSSLASRAQHSTYPPQEAFCDSRGILNTSAAQRPRASFWPLSRTATATTAAGSA